MTTYSCTEWVIHTKRHCKIMMHNVSSFCNDVERETRQGQEDDEDAEAHGRYRGPAIDWVCQLPEQVLTQA